MAHNTLLSYNILKMKGILSIPFILFLCLGTILSYSQKTPWQLRFGYERLWVKPEYTGNIAQNRWTWVLPNRGEIISFQTFQPYALIAGIRYDLFSRWSFFVDYKNFYRRYDYMLGTYNGEKTVYGNEGNQFEILDVIIYEFGPYTIKDRHGGVLRTESLQMGIEFSHPLHRNKQYRLHYFFSLNRDRYEDNLPLYEFAPSFDVRMNPFFLDPIANKKISANLKASLMVTDYNPYTKYHLSLNFGIAISRNWSNGYGLRFELGFRNIYSLNLEPYLLENTLDISLEYIEMDDETREVLFRAFEQYNFPLDIGGPYASISLTSRAFRCKCDNSNYEPPFKRLRKKLQKTAHKLLPITKDKTNSIGS